MTLYISNAILLDYAIVQELADLHTLNDCMFFNRSSYGGNRI
ncbi:MAG: hypothetical protein ACTTJ7_05790 [Treponema sp.]